MKTKLIILALLLSTTVSGQRWKRFSNWSLEGSIGRNVLESPLGVGTTSPHMNLGTRYMFHPKWGVKVEGQFDVLRSKPNADFDYRVYGYRATLEGVYSFFRSKNYNLQISTGIGGSYYFAYLTFKERTFNVVGNFTMLGRVSYWGAIKLNVGVIGNIQQDMTFDAETPINEGGVNSKVYIATVGFVIYLDNNERRTPADWVRKRRR